MNEAPQEIFLQLDPEDLDQSTWCQDRINEDDVRYVRDDLVKKLETKLDQEQRKSGQEMIERLALIEKVQQLESEVRWLREALEARRDCMADGVAEMSEVRIPYLQAQMGQPEIDENHDLVIKKRGGGERRIKAGKWWINRRTSVGEDGEVIERLPNFGRRFIDPCKIIATIRRLK